MLLQLHFEHDRTDSASQMSFYQMFAAICFLTFSPLFLRFRGDLWVCAPFFKNVGPRTPSERLRPVTRALRARSSELHESLRRV